MKVYQRKNQKSKILAWEPKGRRNQDLEHFKKQVKAVV
jgi:hypothetical protein